MQQSCEHNRNVHNVAVAILMCTIWKYHKVFQSRLAEADSIFDNYKLSPGADLKSWLFQKLLPCLKTIGFFREVCTQPHRQFLGNVLVRIAFTFACDVFVIIAMWLHSPMFTCDGVPTTEGSHVSVVTRWDELAEKRWIRKFSIYEEDCDDTTWRYTCKCSLWSWSRRAGNSKGRARNESFIENCMSGSLLLISMRESGVKNYISGS